MFGKCRSSWNQSKNVQSTETAIEFEGFLAEQDELWDKMVIFINEKGAEYSWKYPKDYQGLVLEEEFSWSLQPQFCIHHLDELAKYIMPAHFPQLLLEIIRHQEEENKEGKGFRLWLGLAC